MYSFFFRVRGIVRKNRSLQHSGSVVLLFSLGGSTNNSSAVGRVIFSSWSERDSLCASSILRLNTDEFPAKRMIRGGASKLLCLE